MKAATKRVIAFENELNITSIGSEFKADALRN
jgi:hypothetical protein